MALAEGSLVLALLEKLQLASKGHTIRIGVSGTRDGHIWLYQTTC